MIGLAFAAQLLAGIPGARGGDVPSAVSVRTAERPVPVAVSVVGGQPGVRATALAVALGARLEHPSRGAWRLILGGARLTLEDGLPWARLDEGVVPLAVAPATVGDDAWLPLQVVTDVVPRLAPDLLYDPIGAELRRVGTPVAREAARAGARAGARAAPRGSTRTVVVDAGHGGPDRGMHGPMGCRPDRCLHEADIALEVASALADALRGRGVRVVMTRTRDTLIALSDRGHIANRAKGDLFLSVHVNAANRRWANPGGARGFETFFLSEAKTEDERRVAQMENEAVRFETAADAPPGDDLRFLLNDMAQNEHLRESAEVAALVQEALGRVHPGPSRGVKQAGFRVLVTAFMPAVLVEIGFGTNPGDAAWMSDPAAQRRLASALADAATAYLARYERRVTGGGDP